MADPGFTFPAVRQGRDDLVAWQEEAGGNWYEGDSWFQNLLRRHLGGGFPAAEERLRAVAERAGPDLNRLVMEDNRDENLPVLRPCDSLGEQTDEVVFHPAHHEIGRVFWSSGVLSVLAEPGNQVLSGAVAYLLDQHGEAGHACPVACTAGAILLLQRLGSETQQRRYLPLLLEEDYDRKLHAAQLVTEVQGGSDVGANDCVAVPDGRVPGYFRIWGEKWFCSVADAGLFVVSSRPEGGVEGTGGLGLFLVPRLVDDEPNRMQLRRLKYKLGTRSMATAEIEFAGALAEPIGPLDRGFRNLVGIVLDTSRVHNALAAAGICRRALVEASAYSRHRRAFGRVIGDYPAVQEIIARMRLRTMTALATTLRILAISDRLDRGVGEGRDDLVAARRIAVMINKYWTASNATACARDGIEVLGGNGAIEDFSVLPRLYRDAIVVESWEGTHNTLCAQVLRDLGSRGLHRPWLALARQELAELTEPRLKPYAGQGQQLLAEVANRLVRVLETEPLAASAHIRTVVESMCRLTDWLCLADQLQWEVRNGIEGDTTDALDLYRLLWLEQADPQETPQLIELQQRLAARI